MKTEQIQDTAARIQRIEESILVEQALPGAQPKVTTLAERMKVYSVPGLSLAVIHDGQLELAKGYGVCKNGSDRAATTNTMFQAASISKPVSALAVLRLVQAGRLDLDEDINRYLTTWKVPANDGWQPRVTLHQLISHSAGMTVHGFPGYTKGAELPTTGQILNGEWPANTSAVQVNLLPGTAVRYSGGGYTVMQQVLCDVLGKTFPEIMREYVLAPLGMHRSTYEQPLPEWFGDLAVGHYVGGTPVAGGHHVYPEMAAAGLWTTPTDLAKLALELQRIRSGQPSSFLSKQLVDEMFTPILGDKYGLGFAIGGEGDNQRFFHGGDNVGFKTRFWAYVDQGIGAIIMANGDEASPLIASEILPAIAREYGWPEFSSTPVTHNPPHEEEANEFAGSYHYWQNVYFEVLPFEDALSLQVSGQTAIPLTTLNQDQFAAQSVNATITFVRDEAGTVTGLTLTQNGKDTFAPKR